MRFLMLGMCIFLLSSCGSGKQEYSGDKLVKIFAAVELEPVDKASQVVKEFELDQEENREAYYLAIRELNTNKEQWEAFLKKVEEYRQSGGK